MRIKSILIKMLVVFFSFVFVFCFVGMVRYNLIRKEDVLNSYYIDKDLIVCYGYTIENGRYISTDEDPQMYLPIKDDIINNIKIVFSEDSVLNVVQLYYAGLDEGLSEDKSEYKTILQGENSYSFDLVEKQYSTIRIDLEGDFEIESICLSDINLSKEAFYSIDVLPLVFAVISLILLSFIIYRFKIYVKIKEKIFAEKQFLKKYKENNKVFFFLDIIYLSFTFLFAIFVLLCIWFCNVIDVIVIYAVMSGYYVIWFINKIVIRKERNIALLFLVTSLLLGGMFCLTLPLNTGIMCDDQIHFGSSVLAANRLIGNDMGLKNEFKMGNIKFESNVYIGRKEIMQENAFDDGIKYRSLWISDAVRSNYSCVGYTPFVICVVFNRIFNIPFNTFVILSKFSSCLVYSSVLYFAINRLKSGKLLLACIALLPVNIYAAANFSYDPWVVAFVTYSFAYFIGLLQSNKKITCFDALYISLAMFIGCGPKAIYCALSMVFLFVGKKRFAKSPHRLFYNIIIIFTTLIILSTFLTPFIASEGSNMTDARGGGDVNSAGQVDYIFSHPLEYTKTLLTFLGNYFSTDTSTAMSCSYYYLTGNYNSVFASVFLLLMAFTAFCDRNEYDSYRGVTVVKIVSLFAVFATLCLIATALYISFTPVGATWISGVQWRYCIPLLLPFLYSLGTGKIKNNIDENVMKIIVFGGAAFIILSSYLYEYVIPYTV